jgi:hypothetical protein
MEIFPQLFMLPQVNDGRRFLAAFIHHESDPTHGNNLAEKCGEVNSKTNDGISPLETGEDFFSAARFWLGAIHGTFLHKINRQDAKARRKNVRKKIQIESRNQIGETVLKLLE